MPQTKILIRYFETIIYKRIFFVWLSMLLVSLLFEFLIQIQYSNSAEYEIWHMLHYMALLAARNAYMCFFYACSLGLILAFYQINKTQEWIAALSSKMDLKVFFKQLAYKMLLITLLATLIGEGLAPHLTLYAKKLRSKNFQHAALLTSIWWKENNILTHAYYINNNKLQNILRYHLKNDQLTSIDYADSAQFDGQHWTLHHIKKTDLHKNLIKKQTSENQRMHTQLSPHILKLQKTPLSQQPIGDLYQSMHILHKGYGFIHQDAEMYFWKRIAYPLIISSLFMFMLSFLYKKKQHNKKSLIQTTFLTHTLFAAVHVFIYLIHIAIKAPYLLNFLPIAGILFLTKQNIQKG